MTKNRRMKVGSKTQLAGAFGMLAGMILESVLYLPHTKMVEYIDNNHQEIRREYEESLDAARECSKYMKEADFNSMFIPYPIR
jgi:DNA topoisomerase IB